MPLGNLAHIPARSPNGKVITNTVIYIEFPDWSVFLNYYRKHYCCLVNLKHDVFGQAVFPSLSSANDCANMVWFMRQ